MAMTITMKQLMRPYITMAATVLCRPQNLFIKISAASAAIRVRTLTTSPSTKTHFRTGQVRRFSSTTPHNVNDPGSIDSPLMQSMEIKIKDELNAESVIVKDAYGDGRHVSIVVVSSSFEGQSAVNRQRMVYKAIWEELQNTVHAVDQMITKTPSEAGQGN